MTPQEQDELDTQWITPEPLRETWKDSIPKDGNTTWWRIKIIVGLGLFALTCVGDKLKELVMGRPS